MATQNSDYTPQKFTHSSRARFRQTTTDAATAQVEHGEDMTGSFIGPFKIEGFFDRFMNVSEELLQKMNQNVKFPLPSRELKTKDAKLEKNLYQLFANAISEYNLSPHFTFFIAADGQPQVSGGVKLRPDGGFRDKSLPPHQHQYNTRGIQQNLKIDDADPADDKGKSAKDISRAFNWRLDCLVVEFKQSHTMDPFWPHAAIDKRMRAKAQQAENSKDGEQAQKCSDTGNEEGFEKRPAAALTVRGQLAHYAGLVFAHQHRTHAFQLLICGPLARFIRWDHSGAIVSDSFNYEENPLLLAQFFWRYNHMDDAERGVDLSVTHAGKDERAKFQTAMSKFLANMRDPAHSQRLLPNAEVTINPTYPIMKVAVDDDESKELVEILIQAPFFCSHSIIGRATRGYIAYHISLSELIFFKDTWRVNHPRLIPERQIYRLLSKAGVPCIPKVLAGGDVKNNEWSRTLCLALVQELKLDVRFARPRDFRHHRLLQPLAYPVQSARNLKEFTRAFRACIKAIKSCKKKCNVLHRDVSLGNVMFRIVKGKFYGVLADWDHAGLDEPSTEHEDFRTGTWQFMSIGLLQQPDKPHEVLDDYESVFWASLYGGAHFYEHRLTGLFDFSLFDEMTKVPTAEGSSVAVGGAKKLTLLRDISTSIQFTSTPFNTLITKIARRLYNYYSIAPGISKAEEQAKQSTPCPPQNVAEATPDYSSEEEGDDSSEEDGDHDDTSSTEEELDEEAVKKKLKKRHAKLSQSRTWLKIFDEALAMEGWATDDALGRDAYPPTTAKEDLRNLQSNIRPSLATGAEIKAREESSTTRHASGFSRTTNDRNHVHEQRSEGLAERRVGDSAPRPTVAPAPPQASSSRLPPSSFTDRSIGSSRLKRSIDEVTPHVDRTDGPLEPPAKSRARSRTKAKAPVEPSQRVTRSSSRKQANTSPTEESSGPVDGKKGKETRRRREPRQATSGELGRPRREGLRSRSSAKSLS